MKVIKFFPCKKAYYEKKNLEMTTGTYSGIFPISLTQRRYVGEIPTTTTTRQEGYQVRSC